MSIARQHSEWLSLLDISGPFLSLPVLLRVFPQGLEAYDSQILRELRENYEAWLDTSTKTRPDPAVQRVWVRFILKEVLGLTDDYLAEGQAIPESLKLVSAQYGETTRPDYVVMDLRGANKARMLIHVFPPGQRLDRAPTGSRYQDPIVTRMMEILRTTGMPLALATNGEEWMLVTSPELNDGTTGYISWYAHLWLEEHVTLRAFRDLLGASRFFGVPDDETLEAMLRESATDQFELTNQLGYQVRHAVEVLVESVDRANQDRHGELLKNTSVEVLYEAALTVMMRLVFLFSAEERRLLPLDDSFYADNYAVSTIQRELREQASKYGEEVLTYRYDAWSRLLATFRIVFGGVQHERLNLMAYGGSLFEPDRFAFLEGRAAGTTWRTEPADPLPINNRNVLYILESLQYLRVRLPGGGATERHRLSFLALDIEQIGDIYQTLLDHTAVRADETVLGLLGTRDHEPEIQLATLEQLRSKGQDALLEFLHDETGKSENALRNLLQQEVDGLRLQKLHSACGNDEKLFARVRPFANLVRDDDFGEPVVILPGSVYVTAGMTRRQTQSHYTPRSLTEPLVQHTLEPLVYVGPAEGLPQEQWKLKSAREILQLKVCDMAMGSGSILVQVVRYLGDRLLEAWAEAETAGQEVEGTRQKAESSNDELPPAARLLPTPLRITPEGVPATGALGEELIPVEPEERRLFARRIVADRCIYGVDKNALAVELAKLSIWLVTLDKHRAFTFLNHAFKCGDSLVGADEDMYARWTHSNKSSAMPLYDEQLHVKLDEARAKRRELEAFDVRDVHDVARKQQLLSEADAALDTIKTGCDILVGARLLKLKGKEREPLLNRALLDFVAGRPFDSQGATNAFHAARRVRAFHWFLEFPEVFERGGFDAFVGNPPFLGGLRISTMFGNEYLRYLREAYPSSTGTADLCAFFFLRAFQQVQQNGTFGLLATNTIGQGDTRETGLDNITNAIGTIYRAISSMPWPGIAAVYVGVVHIIKGSYSGVKFLDGKPVVHISSLLESTSSSQLRPQTLQSNAAKSFIGEYVLGLGFVLEKEQAEQLMLKDSKYVEIVCPYLNGEDLNSRPDQSPSRWIINFHNWDLERAKQYADAFTIVKEKVYPQRMEQKDKFGREYWWRYLRSRPEMHDAIVALNRVLVISRITKYLAPTFSSKDRVFNEKTVVFAFEDAWRFTVLQSSLHNQWSWTYSSTLGERTLNYAPTDCFETFPFPQSPISNLQSLETIGETYHEHRRQLMLARQEGLTTTYNRFHNPTEHSADIQRLRNLHVEMDNAVAAAYGWTDLGLGHGFHETAQGVRFTISEDARREVLARLLRLNHERWEEEQKAEGGKQEAGKKRGKKKEAEEENGKGKAKGKKRSVREEAAKYQVGLFDTE